MNSSGLYGGVAEGVNEGTRSGAGAGVASRRDLSNASISGTSDAAGQPCAGFLVDCVAGRHYIGFRACGASTGRVLLPGAAFDKTSARPVTNEGRSFVMKLRPPDDSPAVFADG